MLISSLICLGLCVLWIIKAIYCANASGSKNDVINILGPFFYGIGAFFVGAVGALLFVLSFFLR